MNKLMRKRKFKDKRDVLEHLVRFYFSMDIEKMSLLELIGCRRYLDKLEKSYNYFNKGGRK